MAAHQGGRALLADPVAQRLLQSAIPARLAYTWHDGTPRVVAIWFHWTSERVVMVGPPDAPTTRRDRKTSNAKQPGSI